MDKITWIKKTAGTLLVYWVKSLLLVVILSLLALLVIVPQTGESIWYSLFSSQRASDMITEALYSGDSLEAFLSNLFSEIPLVGILISSIFGFQNFHTIGENVILEEIFKFLIYLLSIGLFSILTKALVRLSKRWKDFCFLSISLFYDFILSVSLLACIIAITNIGIHGILEFIYEITGPDIRMQKWGLLIASVLLTCFLLFLAFLINWKSFDKFSSLCIEKLWDLCNSVLVLSAVYMLSLYVNYTLSPSDRMLMLGIGIMLLCCTFILHVIQSRNKS